MPKKQNLDAVGAGVSTIVAPSTSTAAENLFYYVRFCPFAFNASNLAVL